MSFSPVTFAYGAGLLAAFNPCGFVLLPTWVASFLAPGDGRAVSPMKVSAALTAGFVTVFTIAGLAVGLLGASTGVLGDATEWLGVAAGTIMILIGALHLRGRRLPIRLAFSSSSGSVTGGGFSYGIGYATASLACAFPVFLGAVVHTFTRGGFLEGVASGMAYAAGMATVVSAVVFLTHSSRTVMVNRARRLSRWFDPVAGLLLISAGAVLVARRFLDLSMLDEASSATVSWVDGRRWLPIVVLAGFVAGYLVSRYLRLRQGRIPVENHPAAQIDEEVRP